MTSKRFHHVKASSLRGIRIVAPMLLFLAVSIPASTHAESQDDDLLSATPSSASTRSAESASETPEEAHTRVFQDSRFPRADECATCHPRQYREWSVSQHAYAQLSPLMLSMQNAMNVGTSTTNGDFCLRCHAPVGSDLGEPLALSNLDRHPASREGITCVTCHRMSKSYRKISGRLGIDSGDIFDPIKGPNGNAELERVLADSSTYRVNTDRNDVGRAIHTRVEPFFEMTRPSFCGTCHEVFVPNGLRVHEILTEYRNSPAAKEGTTCNDCHMGREQGIDSGYEHGPAAVVGRQESADRKLTNHFFAGPDYSVVHPGIFPINKRANDFKTLREWLTFDVEAGWGTDEFEDSAGDEASFPAAWESIDDRYEAREIIEEQLELLDWAKQQRVAALQRGLVLSELRVTRADANGLDFEIDVENLTKGHNLPTGFDAERVFAIQVEVSDADGEVLFRSGDRDPNGDLRDEFSLYVQNGEVPLDEQLFNLQSKFITRLARGGEHEQVLTINHSVSPLPFVRPAIRPNNVYGKPKGVRKHRRGIEALDQRTAQYHVAADALNGNGPYRINARFISQAVPVNLVRSTMHVGFDYGMTPRDLARRLVDGTVVVNSLQAEVAIDEGPRSPQANTSHIHAPPPATLAASISE